MDESDAPTVLYRIAEWETRYENHRTRELKKLDFVLIPNRMDSDSYTELMDHPDGAAHLGAWHAILQIASRCKPRGTLMRSDGTPHDPATISRISRVPVAVFRAAIPRLLKVRWLESISISVCGTLQGDAEIPRESRAFPRGPRAKTAPTEGNVTEGNGKEHTVRACDLDRWQEWLTPWPRVPSPDDACRAWLSTVETQADLDGAFAVRDRYLGSAEVARGVLMNPDEFLWKQKRCGWAGKWPAAKAAANGGMTEQQVSEMVAAVAAEQKEEFG